MFTATGLAQVADPTQLVLSGKAFSSGNLRPVDTEEGALSCQAARWLILVHFDPRLHARSTSNITADSRIAMPVFDLHAR